MPTFTVSLTYSYRVEGSVSIPVEAANPLEAERLAVEAAEAHTRFNFGNDFDVSDISVVEVSQ